MTRIYEIILLDKSFNISARVPTFERIYRLASEFNTKWYSRNRCVRLSLSESTGEHSSCVNARARLNPVLFFTFCQVKLVSSTNLLCCSVGVSQRRLFPSLLIFPSLLFALLVFILQLLPRFLLAVLFLVQESTFLRSVRTAVSGANAMPYESVFLLLSN